MKASQYATLVDSPFARVCSWHKTLAAARLAAEKCERAGGSKHIIVKKVNE